MDIPFFTQAAQLGGTVFVTVSFLWYLSKRDKEVTTVIDRGATAQIKLTKALQKLTDMVQINTSQSNKNTLTLSKNKTSIDKNSGVIDKNTEVIKNNGNGK